MHVIAGEKGDTDHEELLSGSHKTVIMKGIVEKGSRNFSEQQGITREKTLSLGRAPSLSIPAMG